MVNIKTIFLAAIILTLSNLTGCTLLDIESTKTETTTPVPESTDKDLQAKVIELEQRIKMLEEKLQGQW